MKAWPGGDINMLRWILLLTGFFTCNSNYFETEKPEFQATPPNNRERQADRKVEELLEQSANSPHGLIEMGPRHVKDYILTKDRSYSIMVFFTALNPANNCGMCQEIHPETQILSEAYNLQRTGEEDHPLFFASVDYQDNEDVFRKMELTQAPVIILVPRSRQKLSLSKILSQVGSKNTYSLMQGKTATSMKEFIERAAKITIDFNRPWSTLEAILVLFVLVGTGTLVYFSWGLIDQLRGSMVIYAFVAMFVFFFCMSGGMFNHIRAVPWAGVSERGRPSYISDQSRYQYGSEGYIMGAINTIAAIVIFLMINANRDGYEKDTQGKPVKRWWANTFPILALIPVVVICWIQIISIYTFKNAHYRNGLVGMRG